MHTEEERRGGLKTIQLSHLLTALSSLILRWKWKIKSLFISVFIIPCTLHVFFSGKFPFPPSVPCRVLEKPIRIPASHMWSIKQRRIYSGPTAVCALLRTLFLRKGQKTDQIKSCNRLWDYLSFSSNYFAMRRKHPGKQRRWRRSETNSHIKMIVQLQNCIF